MTTVSIIRPAETVLEQKVQDSEQIDCFDFMQLQHDIYIAVLQSTLIRIIGAIECVVKNS